MTWDKFYSYTIDLIFISIGFLIGALVEVL
jgi:hypothetical protein